MNINKRTVVKKKCILVIMLVMSVFLIACSTKNESDNEKQKVSILAKNSYYTDVDYENTEVIKNISETSGYELEWKLRPPEIYNDLVRELIIEGSELADIVELPDLDINMEYINTGRFVCLDEYMDYMPNYKKFLQSHKDIKASLTTDDGHIYYVPQTVLTSNYVPCVMYNQEWLEKSGKEQPETLDELVELLRIYKTMDMNGNDDTEDEIPLSITQEFVPYMFGPAFNLDLATGFYVDNNGQVKYSYYEEDNYRQYLEFVNGLYKEGLIDNDYENSSRDTIKERCANNTTGVIFDYSWHMSMLYSSQYKNYDGSNPIFLGGVPLSSKNYQGFYIGRDAVSGVFGITDNDNVINAVKALDSLISDYSEDTYCFGLENVSYYIDEDGNKTFKEEAKNDLFIQKLGINPVCVPSRQSVTATDAMIPEWHSRLDKKLAKYVKLPFPFIYVSLSDAAQNEGFINHISQYAVKQSNDFITGRDSIENLDQFIDTLDNMGIKDIIEIKQKQYNKYIKNMS